MADRIDSLSKPKHVIENGEDWTVTTINIPVWIKDFLHMEAVEQNLRGANLVMTVACTNYFLEKEERDRHNKLVGELFDRGSITEEEKRLLWR